MLATGAISRMTSLSISSDLPYIENSATTVERTVLPTDLSIIQGGTDAYRLGGSELGECWSVISIRISGCTHRQFSVFQTPVGRRHSNSATFRCALHLLDLLSSRSCPTRNEIELDHVRRIAGRARCFLNAWKTLEWMPASRH